MAGEGVQNLCASKDVETNKQDVVGQEHEGSEVVGGVTLAEDVVAEIADVLDLRVFHDVVVHSDGGDPEKSARDEHGDESGYPSEDRQRPGLSHNGKTDLVATEQPCDLKNQMSELYDIETIMIPTDLLPAHGTELDFMLVVLGHKSGERLDGTGSIRVGGIDIDVVDDADEFLVWQCVEVGHGGVLRNGTGGTRRRESDQRMIKSLARGSDHGGFMYWLMPVSR